MAAGIQFVIGWPRGGGGSRTQSVLFHKDLWTPSRAKQWLREHGFRYGQMEEGRDYYRFRQMPPEQFERFATIRPGRRAANPGSRLMENRPTVADAGVVAFGWYNRKMGDLPDRSNPVSDLWSASEIRAWFRGESEPRVWTNLSVKAAKTILRLLEADPNVVRVEHRHAGMIRRMLPASLKPRFV